MAKKKITSSLSAGNAIPSTIKWERGDTKKLSISIWKTWQNIMAHFTDKTIRVSLPVPPILNRRFGLSKTGQFFVTEDHKDYKTNVAKFFLCKKYTPFIGPVGVTVVWYRQRKVSDIDSRIKTLLDSLTGFAYLDDSQIEMLLIVRSDADPKNPRVEVEVEDMSLNVDYIEDSGLIDA